MRAASAGPSTATLEVARRFAQDLGSGQVASGFLAARETLEASETTQRLIADYRRTIQELGWRAQVGALEPTEAEQLTELRHRIDEDPHVAALQRAHDELQDACQQAGDVLSSTVGIDLTTACGPGGCG